ncbi:MULTISPECIES: TonB-dependent receptor [Stenotrophomonas]|uniref:TonB-dependent receptor n=1 Tax=Stenotrophomonas TaxID=40323 RepID=UPI0007705D90|nr:MULTISPECIES: TonB-dependent receptor [Stenotrophomonas]AMJ56250.1 TonB-dependent receptor [Stenotrophomonas sp. KCTC 12332]
MRYRKSVLSAAIVTCISFSAHAQEAGKQATDLDTVVVTGIRASLKQALDSKRDSDAIVDVVTAEDVGKFPATNVAEAITIIPGVTIDKAFGQGEKVSILGTDPALNRTLLNGQTIASADWFISDQPGRTFNYSLLAPQLVSKVEVYKSPEAWLEEGSIGGTVNVSTRKPLDLSGTTISGAVGYLYNDRVEAGDPQVSAMFGWKNQADNFGVIVSAQRSIENIRRDGIESYGTVSGKDYINGKGGSPNSITTTTTDWSTDPATTMPPSCVGSCAETLLANPNAVAPNAISAHYFEQERKRDTLSVALQFKPTDELDIEFNALNVKAKYDNMTHSMFAFNGNPWNSLASMTDVTVDGGVMTKASFRNALTVYDLLNRQATVDTDSYDLKMTWKDERWFASAHAGTSKASGGTGKQVFGEFLNKADYSYDLTGKTPTLNFHGYQTDPITDVANHMKPGHAGSPFTDPSAYRFDGGGPAGGWHTNPPNATNWGAGWGGNIVTKPTEDKEKYIQADFGITLDSPIYQLRFGVKRREHETSQSMAGVSLASIKGYGDLTADQFNPKEVPDSYLSGFGNVGDLSNRFMIDGWALADYINSGKWLAPWQTMPTPSTFSDPSYAANTWTVKENINAAYVQADFSYDRLRGNFGVRLVQTESESTGYACSSLKSPCPADGYVLNTIKKKYNNVLPNINVAYDLNDSVVLRGSAAKVISRPNYGDMSSYLWIGDQTLTGGGGNPNLDPYESTNLDFSAEWYFAENAILAGTAFYKKVDNYVLVTTQKETHYNQSQQTDTVYDISRPNNAGGAKIQGFSAAFQTSLDNGLGLLANYTYADAKADAGNRLPFNSKNQVNFSPFYESERWSARVTYSWRSKYYTQADRGNFLVTDDYDSLDANINLKLTDNLTLGLDGMNLLDSEYRSYAEVPGVANTEKVIRGLYRTGRRYMATLRFAF